MAASPTPSAWLERAASDGVAADEDVCSRASHAVCTSTATSLLAIAKHFRCRASGGLRGPA